MTSTSTRRELHDAKCRAAAMICAIENVRDSERDAAGRPNVTPWTTLREADFGAIADGYLADGLTECHCASRSIQYPSYALRPDSLAARAAMREDPWQRPDGPRCAQHPAFEADYCPVCGTTTPIGDR